MFEFEEIIITENTVYNGRVFKKGEIYTAQNYGNYYKIKENSWSGKSWLILKSRTKKLGKEIK